MSLVELGAQRVAWPWQLDYPEGTNLNAAWELAQGHNIYLHNGPEGFLSAPYPPLFYLVTAPISLITGPSFWPGRLLSFVSTVAIAALIAYIVWRLSNAGSAGLAAGVVAGGLWLSLSPVIIWSTLYKQDMTAMALDLAGLAWVARYSDTGGRKVYFAAVLFALAFFTKQSAVIGMAASTLWLLIRDRGLGLRFAGLLAALIGVPFLLLNALLGGGLWEHVVTYQTLWQTESRLRKSLEALVNEYWPLLLVGGLALLGLALALARMARSAGSVRAGVGSLWGLVVLYALLGWAATLAKSGHVGANFNHLLDGLLPTCILVGLALAYPLRRIERGAWGAVSLGMAAGVGLLLLAQMLAFNDPITWFRGMRPSEERNTEMRGLSELVARTPGDIYSEDIYLLLGNGRRVLYDDPFTMSSLANLGRWDDSVLNQSVRDRRFPLVLLSHGSVRWTEEGLAALKDSYTLKFPGTIDAYEPKLFPDSPQYRLDCTLSAEGDSVSLKGYSLAPGVAWTGLKPGEVLRAAVYWQPQNQLGHDYASYVHVLNGAGERVAGRDNPQTGASRPSAEWKPGATTIDTTAIPLPIGLSPGRYRLIAGMYRMEGGGIKALPATCREGEAYGEAVSLGWVEVK
jgi:Dolichyl-phosphate-mannose-protein mannosyltransferase